jgi:4-aminobutyrate aminotransferase/(S)-3-amino-2-methylpropionate transaminase
VSLQEQSLHKGSATERVQEARERYVARGISTPPLVVSRAEGARVWDAEGREYVDFAGGLGCANLGHSTPAVVEALHAQADLYLHQCFMVGMYEPYVEVCRRLAELSPCRGDSQKSILLNTGAEAVENAVKIARVATGRPAVVVFDNAFHGRTLLSMTMTSKVVPYKQGFGPFAPEVYRTPAPYPFRGISEDDAIDALKRLFKGDVDPQSVACAVLEPVQGEGGFIPMTPDFPKRLQELLDAHGILYVDDEVQAGCGRTGPVWAIENWDVQPDLLVSGKTLGGGLPLAAVTGRAELMDAVPAGGLGGTFGGNPLSCAAAIATLDALAGASARGGDRCAPARASRADGAARLGGTRARPDARGRAAGPERRGDDAHHCSRARPGTASPLLRPLRQRDPHPRSVRGLRRRAGERPRHPRGVHWRLTSASKAPARPTATSSLSTTST